MAIIGIRRLTWSVEDVAACARFFSDFGLRLIEEKADSALFEAADGSEALILQKGHARLPAKTVQTGNGVFECVWAVDTQPAMDTLLAGLAPDHDLVTDEQGIVHFTSPLGQAIALQVWQPRPVFGAPSPSNTVGRIGRLNQPRKWIDRATPKRIHHCVWTVPDVQAAVDYYRDRLNFRITDMQKGFGVYMRADGCYEHHSIFLANAHAPMPGFNGTLKFHHANWELEDIDEIMVAKNYLDRRGYDFGDWNWGLGRHRLTSAAFFYVPCPGGGDVEYGADTDCVDDSWKPRIWDGAFGTAIYMHNLPDFMKGEPNWDVVYARPDQLHYHSAEPVPLAEAAE
jgi:catechol 2,3-dioxygenase-like lactoylglutathione lyase family enzyme